jgi:dipeptidase D
LDPDEEMNMTNDTSSAVASLELQAVWQYFSGIAAVPRASKHEERIREHVRRLAQERGFNVREDSAGNLLIEVPAPPGHENAPLTVPQGHRDMVCEKNAGTAHDFDRDPIRLILDRDPATGEEIVRADGTTLGADNGIGVALALAAATSPDVVHGPLEILCTVDEEQGMTGAAALQPDFFRGKRLLNLDSDEDTVIYIGCAGGGDITLSWEFPTRPVSGRLELARLTVSGLRGGHSGGDIHENRGNANKILVRTLLDPDVKRVQIASITGGSKRNAIPREANAVIVASKRTLSALKAAAVRVQEAVRRESAEPNLNIAVEPVDRGAVPASLTVIDTQRLLWALEALPHGVLEMHQKLKGLVQTSNNVATIVSEPQPERNRMRIVVGCLTRSSKEGRVQTTWSQIAAVGNLARATVESGNSYPGWNPNPESPLLGICQRVYRELFQSEPNVAAIHAGLECGIIGRQMGGDLDMVSFGAKIHGAHSPDERTYPASVQKSYQYLKAVLAELARA